MSKNRKSNTAFKAGIGYTIGNVLIKGINMLTIPIFSRLLTTDDFGIYNVFISYESILFVLVGIAMHTCVKSANLEFQGRINEFTSSISLIYILNLLVLSLGAIIFYKPLTNMLDFSLPMILCLVVYSFSTALLSLYNNKISLQYDYARYLKIALFNSFGNLIVSLILIFTIFRSSRGIGRILGSTMVLTIISIYVLISLYKEAKPKIDRKYWKFAVRYSIPIVPHGISQVLLAQFDRIMIRELVSNSAAGIYSLAGNIKLILTIITDSIGTAWSTWYYEKMEKKEVKLIQQKAIQLAGLFMILTIGLLALSPELIYILGGKAYDRAKYVAMPMVIDAFLLFLYNVIVTAEYYSKKTKYIMFGTIVAAVINVITNYIFIRKFGFIAAAYTTLFSYFCYLFLHIIISKKLVGYYVIKIKWIVIYIGLVCIVAVVFLLYVNSIVVRWGICLLIVTPMSIVLIRVSGILKKYEKEDNIR